MRVLTIGTFDLLHTGHRYLFARAASYGDLTVGVNSDRFVTEYKALPAETYRERVRKVEQIPNVAQVAMNDGPGRDLILEISPDLLVVGSDWADRDYLAQIDMTRQELEEIGCDLLFVTRLAGFSTTALRRDTVTAVVVSRENASGLRAMLDGLNSQTRKPDEVLVYCAGYSSEEFAALVEEYPVAAFHAHADVDDWGHSARARGLDAASCGWVGFFNDDDAYDGTYLEKMLVAGRDVDVVFCEWNENPGCDFTIFQSTAGNFIVRRELAQTVGWAGREYEADGHFIEAVKAAGATIAKVDDLLYFHNQEQIDVLA